MFKQSIIAGAIISAISAAPAYAAQLAGKVVDANNQPLSNATIHLHGKSQSVKSDKNGQFTIDLDADAQLHISKPNYLDQRIQVTESQGYVKVQLKPTSVETIVVYSSALHKNSMEMTSPVSVLSGDELKNRAKPTLGETLKGQPGINASYFGPVSSSPIIRGLGGPRVKITQNGLDSSDASRVGPDHANSNDSLAAQQIEVLRGPATLLYGSGAIGGVVNVVDNRIPTDVIDGPQGAAEYSHDTNSNTNTFALLLETGNEGFNFHFDGVKRKGGDYETPNFPLPHDEHEDEHAGEHEEHDEHDEHDHETEHGHEDEHEAHELEYANQVDNTFIDSEQFNIGTSYVGDHLTVGVSYGRIDTDYGIPAHSHIGHDHGHDEHDHDEDMHDHDEHADEEVHDHEEPVFARVKQDRWQALANYAVHSEWLESVTARLGYTDYEHAEIEGGAVGTVFSNETTELRLTAEHRLGEWHGTLGYHYADSDYAADGAEAFTPATNTKTHAFYILEERQYGDFLLELGARVEDYQLSSHPGSHEEHDDEHDHDHGHEDHSVDAGFVAYELDMTNLSLSVGGVYTLNEGQNLAISLSRSERAPLTAELLSNGLHIATSTYELGLGYELEGDHLHFEPQHIEQETANNLDISFRKFSGDFGYTINVFYNDIENFYYQAASDYIFSPEHGLELADHEHADALPVFKFQSSDAKLYGLEFDAHYKINDYARVKVFGDSLTAKLDNDEYLPRIPSNKLGVDYQHRYNNLTANFSVTHYLKQDNIASYESETDSYTLVDMTFNYDFELLGSDMVGYVNLENLTDELGFVHSSFIKEQAPLPGRNVKLGIRGYF